MQENGKTKENVFGITAKTPGQNVYHAVIGGNPPIGIPRYNYNALLKIFQEALKPDEVDLLCRGFGLLRQRQSQKEIAAELGIDRKEVSIRAHQCIEKLKYSPHKTNIKRISCTPEDLLDKIDELEGLKASDAKLNEMSHRLENAHKSLRASEDARANTEAENARLKRELENARRDLKTAKEANSKLNILVASLSDQIQSVEVYQERVQVAFNNAIATAKTNFHAAISTIPAVKSKGIASLGLSQRTTDELARVSITSMETLCRQTTHTLSRLRVSQPSISEIAHKLKEQGLSLRAG